jgi:predicted nucleic-acid-binding protein
LKLTADTNVLVRAFVEDDAEQASQAKALLERAALIAIPIPVLCEFAWVLTRSYKIPPLDVAAAIAGLLDSETVISDLPAAEAGIAMLRAGGDFADGAIAAQGAALGGTVLASFDKRAVTLLETAGIGASDPETLLTADR